MSKKAVLKYLNLHPQDISQSPRMNLFFWAREEIARQMGIIDKDILEPPRMYLDGTAINREEVIEMLNVVQTKMTKLMKEK